MKFTICVPENPLFFQDINTDFKMKDDYNFISFEFNRSTKEVYIKRNGITYRVDGNNCPIKKIYKKKNNLEIIFLKEDIPTSYDYIYKENEGLRKVDEYRNSMNDLIRNLEINKQSLKNNEKKKYLQIIYYFLTKEIIDVYDENGIKYIHIRNGIFAKLCCQLNNFFNTLENKEKFTPTSFQPSLGNWFYDIKTNEINEVGRERRSEIWKKSNKIYMDFAKSIKNENLISKEEDKQFTIPILEKIISENTELIKKCIKHFVSVINEYYNKDFDLKDKYEFEIDIREKRSKTFLFHRDGTSDFVLFIYPKENPTATLIGDQLSSNLNFLDVRKILPKIDQCDSIIIQNKTQTHATPYESFEKSNDEENLAFIRFIMTEKKK